MKNNTKANIENSYIDVHRNFRAIHIFWAMLALYILAGSVIISML